MEITSDDIVNSSIVSLVRIRQALPVWRGDSGDDEVAAPGRVDAGDDSMAKGAETSDEWIGATSTPKPETG